jgi:hypothetical protein
MNIMTGDEFWFFLHHPHDSAWVGSRDELPGQIKPEIDAEKCLISVIWSVNVIHSLVDDPKGESYHSQLTFVFVLLPLLAAC